MELAFARAVPARRSTKRPCDESSHLKQATRTGEQRRKRQRRRGKLSWPSLLRDAGQTRLRERAQCFPRHQNGWPMFFALPSSFSGKQSSRNLSARRSPHLIPVTTLGGVGSRCQPAHAIARAVTATKHEPGLSPSRRVVSYGSATEVWALLMRLLSHYQRARGEVFAMVALLRVAWIRWLSVVEAAAKPCSSLCLTDHPFQTQNLSVFHETQRAGPTDASFPSRLQKISSPRGSAFLLVPQLSITRLASCLCGARLLQS